LKTLKLILDQVEESDRTIGLVRLVKKIPDHEFVFQINRCNPFNFKRIEDIHIKGMYFDYVFTRFEAYSKDRKTCIWLIANKCSESQQKLEVVELFSNETESRNLMPEMGDVDYILTTSDSIHDFSLILLPENLAFQVQDFNLSSQDELYHLIQYYE